MDTKNCPICNQLFYKGYESDGAGGWYNFNWHVEHHGTPAGEASGILSNWYEYSDNFQGGLTSEIFDTKPIQKNNGNGGTATMTMSPTVSMQTTPSFLTPTASMSTLPSFLNPTSIGGIPMPSDLKKWAGYGALAYGGYGLLRRRMNLTKWLALFAGLYMTGMLDQFLIKDQNGHVNIPAMLTMAVNPTAGAALMGAGALPVIMMTALPLMFRMFQPKRRNYSFKGRRYSNYRRTYYKKSYRRY